MKILVNDFAGHAFQLELSRALAKCGHEVLHTYFAGNNTPKGSTDSRLDGLSIDAVNISRQFRKHSIFSRRAADVEYGKAIRDRIRKFQPHIVLSANTPLDAQQIIQDATRESEGKFVFWLQDILSIGMEFVLLKKRIPFATLVGRFYQRIERKLLRNSDAVVCIAPEFCRILDEWGVESSRTFVIENWAPLKELRQLPRENFWSDEHGLSGKFCFMYSGTLGMKHRPDLLLDLACSMQWLDDVVVVVIADGAGTDWLRENRHRVREGALRLEPFQPYSRLAEVLASSDVLITLLDEECGEFAVPSKTLAYLCAGRSQLIAAPLGNLASQIVQRADAGEAVVPNSTEFLSAAARLLESSTLRNSYAANSRIYAENTFDIERVSNEFIAVFDSVLGHKAEAFGSEMEEEVPLAAVEK
jgi:colanic acid biosynthesis glycosyl transferase WcaI